MPFAPIRLGSRISFTAGEISTRCVCRSQTLHHQLAAAHLGPAQVSIRLCLKRGPGTHRYKTMLPGPIRYMVFRLHRSLLKVWSQLGSTPDTYTIRWLIPVCLAILATVAGCGGDSQSQRGAHQSNSAEAKILKTFGLLRQQPSKLPAELRLHLATILHNRHRGQFAPTQIHNRVINGKGAWVFFDRQELCLAEAGRGSVVCSNPSKAEAKGLLLGTFTPPSKHWPSLHNFYVLGLAPDGVDQVVITAGRSSRRRDVHDNLFSAFSRSRPILVKRFISEAR